LKPIDTELISGSIYTVNIKELEFIDGSIFSNKEEFITEQPVKKQLPQNNAAIAETRTKFFISLYFLEL
jgi:hypothetical protein